MGECVGGPEDVQGRLGEMGCAAWAEGAAAGARLLAALPCSKFRCCTHSCVRACAF